MTIDGVKKSIAFSFLAAGFAILLVDAGCKRLDDKKLTYSPETIVQPTVLPPLKIENSTVATSESSLSTHEAGRSTDEWGVSTEEVAPATRETVYVKAVWTGLFEGVPPRLKMISKLTLGTKLSLKPGSYVTDEWVNVSVDGKEGYVTSKHICPNIFCFTRKRNGLVELYAQTDAILAPQIQIEMVNLFERPITDLKITAAFYYHGELIGQDESFVAAEAIGISPLEEGKSKVLYFRPYYDMPRGEVLSPENPVKVVLSCALESINYVECGEFQIDRMFY